MGKYLELRGMYLDQSKIQPNNLSILHPGSISLAKLVSQILYGQVTKQGYCSRTMR